MTTADQVLSARPSSQVNRTTPIVIPASIIANLLIALVCVVLAISVFTIDQTADSDSAAVNQLIRLGSPVIAFVGGVFLLPAILAVIGSVQLLRRQLSGRYISLVLQFIFMIAGIVALIHLWGFFDSYEMIVDGIIANPWMLLGLPLAYAMYWVGGRLKPGAMRERLETAGALLGMTTVIVVLFVANILTFANNIITAYGDPATWVATLMVLVFGALAWHLLRIGQYFGENQAQAAAWQGWFMLAPNIIGFTLFFAGPLLLSFYLSFTDSTVGAVPNFHGTTNYAQIFALELQPLASPEASLQSALTFGYAPLGAITLAGSTYVLGARDALFWLSLRNTLLYCSLLVPLAVLPALGLALILNSKLPGAKFFRAVYFIPSVAAVVGTALIWRWLYDPTIGFINYTISSIVNGFNSIGFQITDPEIAWLTGPGTVLFSMVLLSAWQIVGFNTVLFLAGLQSIPVELNEAAAIDGADRFKLLRFITIPMLAPTTFFVVITTIITGLQVFNEPYGLFPSVPIPENAVTSVYYLYNQGFFRFNFGYASAIAWVVFAIIFAITLIQFRLQRANAYEG
jgi:multiple sugar transport system permease protein